jgi:hypothetical protein
VRGSFSEPSACSKSAGRCVINNLLRCCDNLSSGYRFSYRSLKNKSAGKSNLKNYRAGTLHKEVPALQGNSYAALVDSRSLCKRLFTSHTSACHNCLPALAVNLAAGLFRRSNLDIHHDTVTVTQKHWLRKTTGNTNDASGEAPCMRYAVPPETCRELWRSLRRRGHSARRCLRRRQGCHVRFQRGAIFLGDRRL